MIPHHFHLIWIGQHFPFVNQLAIESILQTNPNAKVTIHFENPPHNEFWKNLQGRVEFRPIDLAALLQGLPEEWQSMKQIIASISNTYLAGKSNILRYLILVREGGIYLDFDTLTVKDYTPLLKHRAFIGEEAVFRCDDDRVAGKFTPEIIPFGAAFGLSYYLSLWNAKFLKDSRAINVINKILMRLWSAKKLNNAVLACEAGSAFFMQVLKLIPETDPTIRFNLGPILMNRAFALFGSKPTDPTGIAGDHMDSEMTRLGSDYFYTIPPSQTFRFFYGPGKILPENTYTLHWCSSNHKDLAASLTRENLSKAIANPTLFHRLAKAVIDKGIP